MLLKRKKAFKKSCEYFKKNWLSKKILIANNWLLMIKNASKIQPASHLTTALDHKIVEENGIN